MIMNQMRLHAGMALRPLWSSIKDKGEMRIINCIHVEKQTEKDGLI